MCCQQPLGLTSIQIVQTEAFFPHLKGTSHNSVKIGIQSWLQNLYHHKVSQLSTAPSVYKAINYKNMQTVYVNSHTQCLKSQTVGAVIEISETSSRIRLWEWKPSAQPPVRLSWSLPKASKHTLRFLKHSATCWDTLTSHESDDRNHTRDVLPALKEQENKVEQIDF